MSDQLNVDKLIEDNPNVDRAQFMTGMRALEALRDQGVESDEYSLSPPFRTGMRKSDDDPRSVYIPGNKRT